MILAATLLSRACLAWKSSVQQQTACRQPVCMVLRELLLLCIGIHCASDGRIRVCVDSLTNRTC